MRTLATTAARALRAALPALAALSFLAGPAVAQPAQPAQPGAPAATPPADVIMPRALNYAPPVYPPEAKAAGIQGEVILSLDIDVQGHVTKAVVAESGGHGFDEAAIEAAKKLEFDPARKADGTPFAARIKYRYSFTLTPKTPDNQAPAPEQKTAAFSGLVLAAGTDVGLAGANVTLSPGGAETKTDEKGAFAFHDLPPGKYTVLIAAPGYKPLTIDETLSGGESTEVKYRLSQSGALEVTVKGDRPPREVTKRTLTQREIERIPGTNGDALRSLQNLPGVARAPGFLGVLLVRGSGPQDTQTFIDGTPVPLIYHFGGFSSVVPTEILEKIDFYPGNFSSQYGRVQGGIVDVGLRAPKSEYHALLQTDFIDLRALAEGPIPGTGGWTFLAAGRRSIVDKSAGAILSAIGANVTAAPVYYDYQFMVAKKPTPDSSFRVAFFGSDDNVAFIADKPSPGEPALSGSFGFHTAFMRLQTRYVNDFSNGDRLTVLVSFDRDLIDASLASLFFTLDFRSISGRLEYGKKLGKGISINTGVDMLGGYYDVNARLPAPPAAGQPPNQPFSTRTVIERHITGSAAQPAAYVEAEIAPNGRSSIVPGVRVDYNSATKRFDFSPRVNARYDIHPEFPRTTLKGGVGLFHQPPQFQEANPPLGNPNLLSNRAIQYALGVEQELHRQIDLSVEGFYKQLDNLVVSAPSPSGATIQYGNPGTGYVIGSEVLLKYKQDEHFFGWLAYTLSRSIRRDAPDQPEHLVNFDQTHILTVLGSYDFGNGWTFGGRFRLVSGNLVAPNVCDVTSGKCDPARINALFHAASGVYTPIPLTGPATERLPLFQELDLRVDKTWTFKRWKLSAYLDVWNVYNHANVEGIAYNFNYTARQYVAGLPILPNFGVRGELP